MMHKIFKSIITVKFVHVQSVVGRMCCFKQQAIELDKYSFEYCFYT